MARPIVLQRDRRKLKVPISRKVLLRAALKRMKRNATLQDRQNRYNKSHRSEEQQTKYEERIMHFTAIRHNVQPGMQFPLRAVILMADKGVREAVSRYKQLQALAEQMNISIRQAYDKFVLGI